MLASTAASQHGVLTIQQLRAHGLTLNQIDYRVARGELVRRPGQVLLIGGAPETWQQQVSAAALAAAMHVRQNGGDVGGASHRSASRLFGLRSVDTDVDVSIRYPRKLTIAGARVVRSRDLLADDLTWVDGIPVTTPERTICDLGLIFPEPEVMRILRHAVATGLVNQRDVLRMRLRISEHGRTGAGVAGRCLEALPVSAEKAESGLEVMFMEICDRFGLAEPVPQLPVLANGRTYRLDFAYPEHRVFVEIDGAWHNEDEQTDRDANRQNDLVAHGWQPVRFRYQALLSQPEYCADIVRATLASVTREPEIVRLAGHR